MQVHAFATLDDKVGTLYHSQPFLLLSNLDFGKLANGYHAHYPTINFVTALLIEMQTLDMGH